MSDADMKIKAAKELCRDVAASPRLPESGCYVAKHGTGQYLVSRRGAGALVRGGVDGLVDLRGVPRDPGREVALVFSPRTRISVRFLTLIL
jgi:hypothetical protein